MNGLEAAIRNALERAGNPDAGQRARVYQSARAAAEKAFAAQREAGQAGVEDIAAQRAGIEAIIERIEHDEIARERRANSPAVVDASAMTLDGVTRAERTEPTPPSPEVTPAGAARGERISAVAPAVRDDGGFGSVRGQEREDAGSAAPRPVRGDDLSVVVSRDDGFADGTRTTASSAPALEPATAPQGKRDGTGKHKGWFRAGRKSTAGQLKDPAPAGKPRRKRSGLSGLFLQLGLLLGFVALGLWFVSLNGGLEQTGRNLLESGAGMVSGQDAGGPTGQRVGAGQFSGEWTVAFEPGDAAPSAGGAVEFEEVEDQGRPALRITSVSAGEDGELRIPLDDAAVELMRAGPVLLALTVRSAGEEPTQIYVRCAIAGVGEGCGRRRFDIGHESVDILFDLDARAIGTGEAQLILNSDVAGEGKPVTLFSVRLQPAADA